MLSLSHTFSRYCRTASAPAKTTNVTPRAMPVWRIIRLGVMNSLLCHLDRRSAVKRIKQRFDRSFVTFRDSSMGMEQLLLENSESFACRFDSIYSRRREFKDLELNVIQNSPILCSEERQQQSFPRNSVLNRDRWWHRAIQEWVDPTETFEQLERNWSSRDSRLCPEKIISSVLPTCKFYPIVFDSIHNGDSFHFNGLSRLIIAVWLRKHKTKSKHPLWKLTDQFLLPWTGIAGECADH